MSRKILTLFINNVSQHALPEVGTTSFADAARGAPIGMDLTALDATTDLEAPIFDSALGEEIIARNLPPIDRFGEASTRLAGHLGPLVEPPPVNRTTRLSPAKASNIWRGRASCYTAFSFHTAQYISYDIRCNCLLYKAIGGDFVL